MLHRNIKKPLKAGRIRKTEDKAWHDWFDKLTEKDHEEMLAKLGLSKKDKEELEKELKKESAEIVE